MPTIAERGIEQCLEKGLKKGCQEGLAQGILKVFQFRFGIVPEGISQRVVEVEDNKTLGNLYQSVLSVTTLDEFLRNF